MNLLWKCELSIINFHPKFSFIFHTLSIKASSTRIAVKSTLSDPIQSESPSEAHVQLMMFVKTHQIQPLFAARHSLISIICWQCPGLSAQCALLSPGTTQSVTSEPFLSNFYPIQAAGCAESSHV